MTFQTYLNARTLKAVALAASSDPTRFYFCGVLVECRETTVTYVATDGHRMLVVQEDLPELEEGENRLTGNFIIPNDAIKALKVNGRAAPGLEQLLLSAEGSAPVKAMLGDRMVTFIDGMFPGMFPGWRRFIASAPTIPTDGDVAQFNFAYLNGFAKFAKLMEWPIPEVAYTKPEFPHAITFGKSRGFGVLMPLRARGDVWSGAPEWTKA